MMSRIARRIGLTGVLLAAVITIALAASSSLQPLRAKIAAVLQPAKTSQSVASSQPQSAVGAIVHNAAARLSALAAAAATAPQVQFQGTATVFGLNPHDKSVFWREADCSLSFYSYYPMLTLTETANFQDILHQLAGLKTTPDVFAHGCKDPTLGVPSTAVANLGVTASGLHVGVQGQTDHVTDLVAYTATGKSLSYNSTTLAKNVPPQVLGVDLNHDGFIDAIAAGLKDPATNQTAVGIFLSKGDGTFQPAIYYDLPVTANAAFIIDDLNGDGVPDILVPTTQTDGSTQLTALIGKGDGSFTFGPTTAITYTNFTFTLAQTIATGDFNGDGKVDVMTNDGVLHLGRGDGSFLSGTQALPVNYNTAAFAVGDFNNDGKLDIAQLSDGNNNPSGTVAVFLGHGDGSFTLGAAYDAVPYGANMVATDLDGDGNLDLVVGRESNGCFGAAGGGLSGYGWIYQVLMGHGDGTLNGAPVALVTAATGRSGMSNLTDFPATHWSALADFNNDGRLDLLTPGTSTNSSRTTANGLAVSPGLGDGSFGAAAFSAANITPVAVTAADLNGDGNTDAVAVGSSPTGTFVAVLFGNGADTMSGEQDYPLPQGAGTPMGVVTGDFNGDGLLDIAVSLVGSGACGQSCTSGVYVLYGQTGHTFGAPTLVDGSTRPLLAAGNLNGDARADLIVADEGLITGNGVQQPGTIHIYLGNANGTFTASSVAVPTLIFSDIALADLNNDGKLDIILGATDQNTTTQVDVLLGNGVGGFGAVIPTPIAGGVAEPAPLVAAADFDGDGNPDVAFFLGNGVSGILFGSGTGALPTQSNFPTVNSNVPLFGPVLPGKPWAVDLDADHKPDLLIGDASMAGVVSLLNRIGGASLASTITTATASPNPAKSGQSVTLTATVTSTATGTPSGSVNFLDGNTSLGTGAVSGGVATFTSSSLAVGTHSLTAKYSGDTTFSGSTSNVVSLVVAGSSNVSVPNVVGLTQAAAATAITNAGLMVGTITQQSSTTMPSGVVISESPAAGIEVTKGSAVNLVVSSGPGKVTVPNVVGLTKEEAIQVIRRVGLGVGTVTSKPSLTLPAGIVLSESPAPRTRVAEHSPVDLVISSGSALATDYSKLERATRDAEIGPSQIKSILISLVDSSERLARGDHFARAIEEIRWYEDLLQQPHGIEISKTTRAELLRLARNVEAQLERLERR
jgi:Bacterial Ig-like domain (group 3)/PASTA domain/FG-GAP-like repeat